MATEGISHPMDMSLPVLPDQKHFRPLILCHSDRKTDPAADPGPGTQQFDPFADDGASNPAEGSGADAADGDGEPGPKHSADDWDTPPPPR